MHHCAASSNAASSAGGVAGRSGGATSLASASFLRWSSATRERFLRAPLEAGRVHSVFERAVNMLWHDGRLVTLQGPTPLVAPFAATVSRLPKVGNVTPGMAIRQCDGRILFGAVSLSWEGAVLAETRIQPRDESPGPLWIVLDHPRDRAYITNAKQPAYGTSRVTWNSKAIPRVSQLESGTSKRTAK